MASAFRKFFRSGEKLVEPQYQAARGQNGGNGSARSQGSAGRGQSTGSGRGQTAGAWGQATGASADLTGGAVHNNLNSPSSARRFFSRHTYLEGSRVGPAEGVVAQHSPKTNRAKNSSPSSASTASSSAASNSSSSGGIFKKSPTTGLINESTTKHMKMVRTRRLMKEYQELTRVQQLSKDPVFTVDLVNDCLYEWKVKLLRVDSDSELYRDMQELGIHHILLSLSFPENFPFHPPFLRVLSPRLEKGFVMEGGAICMELLTPRGWASAYTVEAVIMQFAASLVKGQGRISRKQKTPKEFNKRSAESAFRSLVKTHEKYGWVTPPLSEG